MFQQATTTLKDFVLKGYWTVFGSSSEVSLIPQTDGNGNKFSSGVSKHNSTEVVL